MEPTDVKSVVAVGFCCADVYQDLGSSIQLATASIGASTLRAWVCPSPS